MSPRPARFILNGSSSCHTNTYTAAGVLFSVRIGAIMYVPTAYILTVYFLHRQLIQLLITLKHAM